MCAPDVSPVPVWELFSTDRHRQVQTKKSDRQTGGQIDKLAELQLLTVETLVAVLKHESTRV